VTRGSRIAAIALGLAVPATGAGWLHITPPLHIGFPRDHGAHPEVRSEWWYTTGTVTDSRGHRFGFELTFFRESLAPSPPDAGSSTLRSGQILAAHLAVVDIDRQSLRFAQRVRRDDRLLAAARTGDLDVFIADWEMHRLPSGTLALRAEDRNTAVAIALDLEPEKPYVLHGDGGVCRKGARPGNASAYVSCTRLTVNGRLTVDGRGHAVTGQAWLDHEWGTSRLDPGVVGWDWVGLRLADGRDLMLYRLRRTDGSAALESAGTLVGNDGTARHLGATDFVLEPVTWWTSPHTGARYPARLRVRVPGAGLVLDVAPLVADAEIDARASTETIYWEGPVRVGGTLPGEGYAELTGYAGATAPAF
jgi:predicted secreted hydrolase